MKRHHHFTGSGRDGAALIITLAFMVLLSALLIIFFTQSMSYRLESNSNFNDFKSASLGKSALETVVGDLRQEIINGSTAVTNNGVVIYTPTTNLYMVPQRSGNPAAVGGVDPIPNLIRVSLRADSTSPNPEAFPEVSSRASAVNSTTDPAEGGQYIAFSRWNKHYLIPRQSPGSTAIDTTPVSSFVAPDWVYVTDQGPTVLTAPTKKVIGRYAYAIYDEGGLLDANVVGVPSDTATNAAPHPTPNPDNLPSWGSGLKGSEAFADLTVNNPATGAPILSQAQIDQLVGWRDNATAQPGGSFSAGYSFTSASAVRYYDAMASSTNGFLATSGNYWSNPATTTDQLFPTRQSLINFFIDSNLPQDSLQYLATFTRALEQPCYNPPVGRPMVQDGYTANNKPFGTGNDAYGLDRVSTAPTTNAPSDINPPFLSVRVTTGGWQRADGTQAVVGEPLIKERFPLSRLGLFPINEATPTAANAALIYQYFGLTKSSSGVWMYNHDTANPTGIDRLSPSPSGAAGVTSLGREPDFFELLKAAINVGSIGKGSAYNQSNVGGDTYLTAGSIGNLLQAHDTLTNLQILQIGANIIDQYKSDNFPTRIQFLGDSNNPPNIVCGSEDLPYIYRLRNWITQYGTSTATSQIAYLVQPELWDPYSYNAAPGSGLGSSGFLSGGNTPTTFRMRLEPDTSLLPTASPINFLVTYQDGTVVPLTNVSLDYPNYKSTASAASGPPNPTPLTFNAGELNNFWGFREPTLLAAPALCPSAHLNAANFYSPFLQTDVNNGTTFTGFVIATFPWIDTAVSPTDNANKVTVTSSNEPACLRCYLEYQDPSNPSNYITYDQQVIEYQGGASGTDVHAIGGTNNNSYAKAIASLNFDDCGWIRTDPRTCRWGAMYSEYFYSLPLIDSANNEYGSERADGGISFGSHLGGKADDGFIGASNNYGKQYRGFQHGYWAENSVRQTFQTDGSSGAALLRFNLDPDGVPRRAMAGYVTDSTDGGVDASLAAASQPFTGLPMAIGSGTVYNTFAGVPPQLSVAPPYGSRPTILHRPFRSVAEMGYAFRDTPWGNINFTFPESGDSALLDVFCLNDTSSTAGLVAGRVDLNTRQAPVLASLISGSLRDKDDSTAPVLSQAMATDLATQLVTRTSAKTINLSTQGPLMSRADLVGTWMGATGPATSAANLKIAITQTANGSYPAPISPDNFYTGFSHDIGTSAVPSVNGTPNVALIPRQRNAVMRGLVDSGTTRTWNLLIDLVAQSGRFSPNAIAAGAAGLPQFTVEGEKHYWLHVAIDRCTGKILDSQLEVVKE